jgi:hypothetical protein
VTLKKASNSLTPHDRLPFYNPVFVAVGNPLQDYINARYDTSEWDADAMYVSERMFVGIDDGDILTFAREYRREVMALVANAGVGKSTFVEHCEPKLRSAGFLVLKFNLLNKKPGKGRLVSVEQLIDQFKDQVIERLDAELQVEPAEWWQFVLEMRPDRRGQSKILLEQMRGGAVDATFYKDLRDFMRAVSFVDMTALHIRFLRERRAKRPIIILDNVDRLDVQYQKELLLFGGHVAGGSMADKEDHCPVIIALRPDTLEETDGGQQGATRLINVGHLAPPRLELVFMKRLNYVIDHWEGRLMRGVQKSKFDHLAESEARDLVKAWGEAALLQKHAAPLVNDLHAQVGYNTRMSLLAIANYLASGHLTARSAAEISRLTANMAYKALLLGNRAYYITGRSWAYNLFADETVDDKGALITCRILKQFLMHRERSVESVAFTMRQLFGYEEARVRSRQRALEALGLLEVGGDNRRRITEPGRIYMQTTLKDFEYLQHVLVDTWVDKRYVVECTNARDENGVTRLSRVVKFAQWVRELELTDYTTIVRNHLENQYAEHYGDDTLSESLAVTLNRVAGKIPGVDRAHDLLQELATLTERSPLAALRVEAQSALKTGSAAQAAQ